MDCYANRVFIDGHILSPQQREEVEEILEFLKCTNAYDNPVTFELIECAEELLLT